MLHHVAHASHHSRHGRPQYVHPSLFIASAAIGARTDASFLARFPLSLSPWTAESGIVSSVAAPLADAGISIFQLSTYESDYCLVPEDKLSAAIGCLKSAFKVKDVVLLDGDNSPQLDDGNARLGGRLAKHSNGHADDDAASADFAARNLGEIEHVTDASGHRRNGFSVAPYQLYLTSISHEYIDLVTAPLIKLIFYPEKCASVCALFVVGVSHDPLFFTRSNRFFSMTRTDNTISLILDSDALNMFPEDYLNAYRESWKIIKVADGPLGFDETGIVKDYATALASAKVSIFYLSTFLTDYILVHRMDLKKAVNTLSRLNQSS